MLYEVAIQMIAIFDALAAVKVNYFLPISIHPCGQFSIRCKLLFPFPENQEIGKDIRARSFKQLVRQPDGTNQFALLSKLSPERIILLVHCAVTCDRNDKTARPDLIHHLLQEIVVNKIIPVIVGIRDDIVSERNIGNR